MRFFPVFSILQNRAGCPGDDLFEFEEYLRSLRSLSTARGNSEGVDIATECGLSLVHAGFPICDRFANQEKPVVGYRGGERLLFKMVNTIMGHHYPDI